MTTAQAQKAEIIELTKEDNQVVYYDIAEASIADMGKRFEGMTADTPEQYAEVKKALKEVSAPRIAIEKKRVVLNKPHLDASKEINKQAKHYTLLLEKVEDPLRDTKKAYDDKIAVEKAAEEAKEQERIESIQKKIGEFTALPLSLVGKGAEEVENALSALKKVVVDESFAEFTEAAIYGKNIAINKLDEMLTERTKYEEDQAELEAFRAKQEVEKAANPQTAQPEPMNPLEVDKKPTVHEVATTTLNQPYHEKGLHYDSNALYEYFLEFQKTQEGMEVTEDDLLLAWREANKVTGYHECEAFN